MKITIEPTDELFEAQILVPADGPQLCRKWTGVTDDGVEVHAWILAVSPQTHDEGTALRFATELRQRDVRIRE